MPGLRIHLILAVLLASLAANAQSDKAGSPGGEAPAGVRAFDLNGLQATLTKRLFDSFIHVKKLTSNLGSIIASPVAFRGGSVSYSGSYNNSYFNPGGEFLSQGDLSSDWALAGVPLEVSYRHDRWSGFGRDYFSVRFDRDNYLSRLGGELKKKLNPQSLLSSIPDPLALVKQQAEEALRGELASLNVQYGGLLRESIAGLGSLDELMSKDIQSLRQQFLPPSLFTALRDKEALLEQLQTRINLGAAVDTIQYHSLKKEIMEVKALQELVGKIDTHKKKWLSSGLVSKIREWDLAKKVGLEKLLRDPGMITQMARSQLNLNSFQRFFLKLNRLNLGRNSLSASPLSFQNYLNNGALAEFMNKGKSTMLFLGRFSENASVLDLPFYNTAFGSSAARAIQLGKSGPRSGSMNISIAGFEQGLAAAGLPGVFDNFRRSLVTTLNKEFLLGTHGSITTEVSRSVSSYNPAPGDAGRDGGLLKLLSAESLADNTSFALNYRDEFPGIGLSYQVKVNKTANGYDNPGNPYLNTGSQSAGVFVRKKFLKDKLLLSLRTDVREFRYSEKPGDKWRTTYSVLDARLKLGRGQFVSLRYLPTRMNRLGGPDKIRVSNFDRLSLDGSMSKRIRGNYYNSYFSLSYQRNQYNLNTLATGNSSVGFVANQTLAVKKQVFYWNTQLNRTAGRSQLHYFNSGFNTELGTTFTLFKSLRSTTSFSYNEVTDWYRQLGLRQNISVQAGEKFELSFFVDARKNLKLYQPLMFGQTRGEVSLHYLFNTK